MHKRLPSRPSLRTLQRKDGGHDRLGPATSDRLARFEADIATVELTDPSILHDLAKTRANGEIFFESKAVGLLRVPSVVLPEEFNLVMNPLHPDAARIHAVSQRPFLFDHRLLQVTVHGQES